MSDPRQVTKLPKKPNHASNPVGNRTKTDHRTYKKDPSQDLIFFSNNSKINEEEEEEEARSPTLWSNNKNSNSPRRSPQFPHRPRHHRPTAATLSPNSRTQAIAKGQQELMEMVRNMPESCYELSLKDLVEYHQQEVSEEEEEEEENLEHVFERDDSSREALFPIKKRNENRGMVMRSRSVDSGGGFYLKMFFPLSFGPTTSNKKKKKKDNINNGNDSISGLNSNNSKVSPKPPVGGEREWWRKRCTVAGDGEGGGSSKSSGSSSSTSSSSYRSNSRHAKASCWFCMSPSRSKNTE